METFKSMQQNVFNEDIKRKKSDRVPNLPYIMDNCAVRRTIAESVIEFSPKGDEKKFTTNLFKKNLHEKLMKNAKKCESIDQVISKCESLEAETKKLRFLSTDFHYKIDQKIEMLTRKNTVINF